ncbi:MAG: ubiquinone biosynthesis protein [Alphaproteobacteria bacterium]|nr:ubiquinone biosynthesis protein [Alphaproteobacteria bacterium]MBL6938417.1 ubiquinone biosynthesis protein [Alphaproteobacteria bacterium]MBL7096476.1 ubiquinone biosynthesis protein [Alphaproteobacteria bacterium]
MNAVAPAQEAPLDLNPRKDWTTAFRAMGKLLSDPNDTTQVFKIMRALNAGTAQKNYDRLLTTAQGGRLAYERLELIDRLMNREWLNQFAPGTVGAAYRAFLDKTGYSAQGLADIGNEVHGTPARVEHPYAWFGRRERDLHDIWHVLTGYQADDPLGELCLVAFTYAQTRGTGWGFIALMGVLKSFEEKNGKYARIAVREGFRHGKQAAWLHGEDVEKLFAEPLETARVRLNIAKPEAYLHARDVYEFQAAVNPVAVAAE